MSAGKKARILVIDDDANLLRVMGVLLERANYAYFSATNGVEGLSAAERIKPDLILLDVALPFMKGTEVCRRLRDQPQTSRVPIIMLSSLERIEDKLAGFEAGADDYVTKPVNPKELLARINALLVRSQETTPQPAHTIAVIGAKGGVGVTSLVVNMAAALLQRDYAVTVAELRSGHGELDLHCKLPSEPNLGKLLQLEPNAIGRPDVERYVQTHESGLRVLLAPPAAPEGTIEAEHAETIISVLQRGCDFLLLDLPPVLTETCRKALEAANVILLVSEPEALSAACGRRMLRMFNEWELDDRVSVVAVARVPSGTTMTRLELENELSTGRLERKHGREDDTILSVVVVVVVPPEPEAFQESVRKGVPLVRMEPSARSSRAISELAGRLAAQLVSVQAP